jgi:predicted nucleic acid-binding protein
VAAIVIADASPLIALARVNGLGWLQQLFAEVVVSEVVLAEVLTGRYPASETPIQQALAAGWLRAAAVGTSEPALPDLDEGEVASIRLALGSRVPVLLLIDERAGRAVAQDLGLSVAGTAAVIGLARQRGLIPSARAVFAALHASEFRMAPAVIQAVLERCGEGVAQTAGPTASNDPLEP